MLCQAASFLKLKKDKTMQTRDFVCPAFTAIMFSASLLMTSCSDDSNETRAKDMEKPRIEDGQVPNPIDCQVYARGQVIPLRYTFTDNQELGNFNIEIHNNFDHHSHSTSAAECTLDPKKSPINPWVFNQSHKIPEGAKTFEAKLDITIPKDIDPGDYHFMIRVTDKAGWQQLKAVSIKIKDASRSFEPQDDY